MEIVFTKDKKKRNNPFAESGKKLIEKIKKFRLPASFYYFLVLLAVGMGFYMLMLIQNNFSLAYGGDYSAQYIPMGYHVWDYYHEWFATGHFKLFDQDLYLGVNSFGSNAYYGLFSPFNIIIILSPHSLVPQAMAISSIIKLACAGLFFSIYMSRAFKVKDSVARLCGVAYAFAGWGAFYLWYNNYQDILVFFPLVLLGIEKTIQEQKPWLLCVGVFFLAICNYVLMVSYIICVFLYAMFRFFQTIRKRTAKDNFSVLGLGFIGFAGGLLMSMFIFAPAFMATMSSPKLEIQSYGDQLKALFLDKKYGEFFRLLLSWGAAPDQHGRVIPDRVYYPIIEFFFPATTCRSLPTLELSGWDFDDIAVSLWCYVPFIMFLVPALIQSVQEKKWTHLVGFALLVFSLFTPVMYYLTMGFSNGYARWTLFIVASLVAYVGIYIDKIPNVAKWHFHVGFIFAVIGMFVSWLLTAKLAGAEIQQNGLFQVIGTLVVVAGLSIFFEYRSKGKASLIAIALTALALLVIVIWILNADLAVKGTRKYGELIFRFNEEDGNYTNTAFIVEIAYAAVVYLAILFTRGKKPFMVVITLLVSIEAIAMGNFVTIGHGYDTGYNNGYANNERFRTLLKKIESNDKSFYRMYTSIGDDYSRNNSLMNGYSSGSFFHSLYNFEIDDFTLWTGMRNNSKSVGDNYRGKFQDLDKLLGVKYYVISKGKTNYTAIEKQNPGGYIANVPFDFEEREDLETSEYKVYENKNQNGFGYAYDTLYDGELVKSQVNYDVRCIKNAMVLSTNAVVSKEDAAEINKDHSDIAINSVKPAVLDEDLSTYEPVTFNNKFYLVDGWAKYYNFDEIPDIPRNIAVTPYSSSQTMRYFVFYTSKTEGQPIFKAGTALYVRAPFKNSKKYNFYFIDKNNKIFMFDSHDDDTTDATSYMRGFYIKKDVYKLAICGKYFESYLSSSNLNMYQEDISVFHNRWSKLEAEPITEVTYTEDKFTFKTNYSNDKFVVSRVAYDAGWKIKMTNNDTKQTTDLKVYKGNGGFVSFIAPKGNYSYVMEYETPYLKLSYLVSTVSFMTFFVSMLGYHIYQEKKRPHHLDGLGREN